MTYRIATRVQMLLLMSLCSTTGCRHVDARQAADLSPFKFEDVTERAGIRFQYDNGATGHKYLPETMGSGCALLDYDQDGRLDVLLLNGAPIDEPLPAGHHSIALYHNNGNGTFQDVTAQSGMDHPMYAMGAAVGDYDNDGYPDVYVTTVLGTCRLFHNRCGRTGPIFENVTARAGVGADRWCTSALWFDFDNDGYLDLFVCRYVRYASVRDDRDCSTVAGQKGYCPPDMYDGDTCVLYRSRGDGTFQDVSRETGITRSVGDSLGVAMLDYDGDGWPDLFVTNDKRPNFLFHNLRAAPAAPVTRRFEEVGMRTGVALDPGGTPRAGMGVDVADAWNDGHMDVAVSNFSDEGMSLYRQQRRDLFVDAGPSSGVTAASYLYVGFGLVFADFDSDGLPDLLCVDGHVFPDAGAGQPNITYKEPALLFHNEGAGRFREVGAPSGRAFRTPRISRGAAVGDVDNDGKPDVLIANNDGAPELLRNECPSVNHWLDILVHGGMRPGMPPHGANGLSNRDAIGARVTVTAGGSAQTQWVHSGSSYLSDSMHRLHFGLGSSASPVDVDVRFPGGGHVHRSTTEPDQLLVVEEHAR